tara:strand:- start:57 stop:1043 length:987 start_codon:yes stop_codon:yes gene_type:complete
MILDPTDQNIRDQGFNFVPFDRYLASPFQPYSLDMSGGISTLPATSKLPILNPNLGAGGEGGGITSVGPQNAAFDYEFDALGGLPNKDNVGLTDEEQDALDDYSNPGLNAVDIGTMAGMGLGFTNPITGILGLVFNQRRKKQKAKEEAEAAAAARETREAIARDQARENPDRDQAVDSGSIGGNFGEDQGTRCFEPNTLIQMADGSEKKIKEIQLGDQTKGGEVTGVFQFKVTVDEIHNYKGVTVAGSHFVKENGKFIMVQDSPISVKIDKIPVVYSLDTTGRRIFIKDIEFADYNGDGIAKGFLANAGVDLTGFDKEVLRQVENRLI